MIHTIARATPAAVEAMALARLGARSDCAVARAATELMNRRATLAANRPAMTANKRISRTFTGFRMSHSAAWSQLVNCSLLKKWQMDPFGM